MKNIFNNLTDEAKKDKDILAVALFGSYARGEKHRDIDIALILSNKKAKIEMSKIRLKYLSKFGSDFDIHIFQQLPVYIKTRVLKEGKFILNKNEDKVYEIAFQTMKEFGFYKKIYYNYINTIK